jgi:hypothetical protein
LPAACAKAQQWADAAKREVEDVMAALDDALAILDEHVIYEDLPESARRLVNQAVFLALVVSDPDNVQAELTPLYETIKQLIQELRETKERPKTRQQPTTPGNKTGRPQNDRDPDFRGRGSYIGRMAGATGLEPATSAVTGQRSNRLSYAPAIARIIGARFRAPPVCQGLARGPVPVHRAGRGHANWLSGQSLQ